MTGPSHLTVVIPCFNAAKTLTATIESVLDQEVKLDLLVVDDGSSDGSLAMAHSFCPRVRILTGPNQGVSAARNRAIVETSSEWIVFLDADDLLLPGTLRHRLDTAAATQGDVVICDWQELVETDDGFVDGQVRRVDLNAIETDAEIAFATHVWATTAALMFRRSLIRKVGQFRIDLPIIQDARFIFDAAFCGARFAYSPHVGARYRIMKQSLSRGDPEQFWRDVLANGVQIESLWRARGQISLQQRRALSELYNTAARGLFRHGNSDYFRAVDHLRQLGGQLPLHPHIAEPLARILGLKLARHILALLGR